MDDVVWARRNLWKSRESSKFRDSVGTVPAAPGARFAGLTCEVHSVPAPAGAQKQLAKMAFPLYTERRSLPSFQAVRGSNFPAIEPRRKDSQLWQCESWWVSSLIRVERSVPRRAARRGNVVPLWACISPVVMSMQGFTSIEPGAITWVSARVVRDACRCGSVLMGAPNGSSLRIESIWHFAYHPPRNLPRRGGSADRFQFQVASSRHARL